MCWAQKTNKLEIGNLKTDVLFIHKFRVCIAGCRSLSKWIRVQGGVHHGQGSRSPRVNHLHQLAI